MPRRLLEATISTMARFIDENCRPTKKAARPPRSRRDRQSRSAEKKADAGTFKQRIEAFLGPTDGNQDELKKLIAGIAAGTPSTH